MSKSNVVQIPKAELIGKDQKITEQAKTIKAYEELLEKMNDSTGSTPSFSNHDQEQLGELFEPMKKLVETQMAGSIKQFEGIVSQLNDKLTNIETVVQDSTNNVFKGVLTNTVQGYDKVKGTESWESFLDTKIPGTGATYRDSWTQSFENKDAGVLNELVELHNSLIPKDEPKNANPEPNIEPTGSGVESNPNLNRFKYKASDMQAKVDAYKEGTLSQEDFESFETKFNEATDAGQVLNDINQGD